MKKMKCCVKDCPKFVHVVKHRLCWGHVSRYYKGQYVHTPLKAYKKRKPYRIDK